MFNQSETSPNLNREEFQGFETTLKHFDQIQKGLPPKSCRKGIVSLLNCIHMGSGCASPPKVIELPKSSSRRRESRCCHRRRSVAANRSTGREDPPREENSSSPFDEGRSWRAIGGWNSRVRGWVTPETNG
ncbi:hypothetical protein SDJN03_06930, partial [Cucurbita argyrosperma subsp. sororia]